MSVSGGGGGRERGSGEGGLCCVSGRGGLSGLDGAVGRCEVGRWWVGGMAVRERRREGGVDMRGVAIAVGRMRCVCVCVCVFDMYGMCLHIYCNNRRVTRDST